MLYGALWGVYSEDPTARHLMKGTVLVACAATTESPPVLGGGVDSEKI
jgi:hypothetical protein